MKRYLEKIPEELKGVINKVRDIAGRKNIKAYLVGGFVRDLALGVKNIDLDIVIEGDGIKFAENFANITGAKITMHQQFGTATVFIRSPLENIVLKDEDEGGSVSTPDKPLDFSPGYRRRLIGSGLKIDFSSARKEYYPRPAHLPVVKPGSLRDDLFRRDFTINAMAVSLNDGRLLDYFGGMKDLEDKKIRVLHPLSFMDDPTRILRAIRFEQRHNFRIEPKTLRLINEAVGLNILGLVHPHRIRDDLIAILKEENAIRDIRRLDKLTGFDFILPGLVVSKKTYSLLKAIEKEIDWFENNCGKRRILDAWLVYLMGLLDALDAASVKRLCEKSGLRRGEAKRLLSYRQVSRSFILELSKAKAKPSKVFALLEPLSYEAIIALKAKYGNSAFNRNVADFLRTYNGMRIFICGKDLQGLGVLPGPRYQQILAHILKAKLNGKVKTKDEELSLIRRLIDKRSSHHVKTG